MSVRVLCAVVLSSTLLFFSFFTFILPTIYLLFSTHFIPPRRLTTKWWWGANSLPSRQYQLSNISCHSLISLSFVHPLTPRRSAHSSTSTVTLSLTPMLFTSLFLLAQRSGSPLLKTTLPFYTTVLLQKKRLRRLYLLIVKASLAQSIHNLTTFLTSQVHNPTNTCSSIKRNRSSSNPDLQETASSHKYHSCSTDRSRKNINASRKSIDISTSTSTSTTASTTTDTSTITTISNSTLASGRTQQVTALYSSFINGAYIVFADLINSQNVKGYLLPTTVGRLISAKYKGSIISINPSGSLKISITLSHRLTANNLLASPYLFTD